MKRRCVVLAAFSYLSLAAVADKDVQLRATRVHGLPAANAMIQSEGGISAKSSEVFELSASGHLTSRTVEVVELSTMGRLKSTLHQYLHPLSAAAVITTVALQLSPMPSSLEIRRERDVKRYDGYPYFAVLAGATQWCLYGSYAAMTSGDMNFLTMVAANFPGTTFGIFYITNFFRYCPDDDHRNGALKQFLSIGLVILLTELATCVLIGRAAVFWLGLLGAIGSAQIALSPFKTLPEVLRTRSTRSWPVDLCVWNLIQSWFTGGFGLANNDVWVWAPNLVGVIAAVFQLTLIACFWEQTEKRGSNIKLKAAAALA